jgi:hypothetical protein
MNIYSNVFTIEEINDIVRLHTVQHFKTHLVGSFSNVYFTINLPNTLKEKLQSVMNLDLSNVDKIPMRWIKGDTKPHVDRGPESFVNTFLMYLTDDNQGQFKLEENVYPMKAGNAFVFPEQVYHETINTGQEPRLLLGPMNEAGQAVGGAGIYADGETEIVYIKQDGGDLFFKVNEGDWNLINFTPFIVYNTNPDPAAHVLKVLFTTDITLTTASQYFIATRNGIQFGNTSLQPDGNRVAITLQDIPDYPGVFQNNDTYSNIYIYNIFVNSTGTTTLADNAGWIGGDYFATNGAENYIVNCKSNGAISSLSSGGIVGRYAGYGVGSSLYILGCSSSGAISGPNSGGIAGQNCGGNNGILNVDQCWSTGVISGTNAGGIFGSYAGSSFGQALAISCYSTGAINSSNAGGIFGQNAASTNGYASATACYSIGNMISTCGGIYGANAGSLGGVTVAQNCYTTGNIASNAGGIFGTGGQNITAVQCYTTGTTVDPEGYIYTGTNTVPVGCYSEAANASSGWNKINAMGTLNGVPNPVLGFIWTESTVGQPFELTNMGYTSYSLQNIFSTYPPNLIALYSQTINAGSSSSPAILSNKNYAILQVTGGSFSINSITGAITANISTPAGTYYLYIRNTGSYNISQVEIIVNNSQPDVPCLTRDSIVLTPSGYVGIETLKQGDYVLTSDERKVQIKDIYSSVVPGHLESYPCFIPKDFFTKGIPSHDFLISQTHLIYMNEKWMLPKDHFILDSTLDEIHYYHIELENYVTDHLVINGGVVVESLGKGFRNALEYYKRLGKQVYITIPLSRLQKLKE